MYTNITNKYTALQVCYYQVARKENNKLVVKTFPEKLSSSKNGPVKSTETK